MISAKRRILVAEDNEVYLTIIVDMLRTVISVLELTKTVKRQSINIGDCIWRPENNFGMDFTYAERGESQ